MKIAKPMGLLAVLLIMLAACGGQPAAEEAPEPADTPTEAATAPELTEAEQASNGCEAGTRAIDHDYGTTCVPDNPQRVAVLDIDVAAFMRVLNIKPVALDFTQWSELVAASPEWGEAGEAFIADAVDIGEFPYNLEAIATSNPDLILAAGVEEYDLLSDIAPTVAFNIYDNNEDRWFTFTEYFGNVLNANDEAQTLIDATNERIAALGEYAKSEAGNPSISVFSSWDGTVNYGAPYFVYNQIMTQADITRPENQALTQTEYDARFEEYWANVSLEQLDTIDADYLLLLSFDWREGDEVEAFRDEPIWAALDAVQNDQFLAVPGQQWLSFDAYSVNKTIDDLFRIVANVDPTEVAPNPFLADEPVATTSGEAAGETRTITHAMGESEVPAAPQRVVTLDTGETDNALALGANVIGAPIGVLSEFQGYLVDQFDGITNTGTIGEPNLETIVSLNPDLILGSKQRYEEIYNELSAIAPTVLSESLRVPWQDNLRLHAEALGKTYPGRTNAGRL